MCCVELLGVRSREEDSGFGLDSERGTLNFLAIYISSILKSLNFLGPGC